MKSRRASTRKEEEEEEVVVVSGVDEGGESREGTKPDDKIADSGGTAVEEDEEKDVYRENGVEDDEDDDDEEEEEEDGDDDDDEDDGEEEEDGDDDEEEDDGEEDEEDDGEEDEDMRDETAPPRNDKRKPKATSAGVKGRKRPGPNPKSVLYGTAVNKRHRCEEVPRDKVTNKPILPIVLSATSRVLSLGTIVFDRPGYHNQNYIWPVGYVAEREYQSVTTPNKRVMYRSEIIDNGDNPLFKLTAADKPSQPILGISPTSVWQEVVRKVADLRAETGTDKRSAELKELLKLPKAERMSQKGVGGTGKGYLFASISGPEYFGLSLPTILKLVEEMPNSDKCIQYEMKNFKINFDSVMIARKKEEKAARTLAARPKPRAMLRKPSATHVQPVGGHKGEHDVAATTTTVAKFQVASGLSLMAKRLGRSTQGGDTDGYDSDATLDDRSVSAAGAAPSLDEIQSEYSDVDEARGPERADPRGEGVGEHERLPVIPSSLEGKSLNDILREVWQAKVSRLNTVAGAARVLATHKQH